MTSATIVEQDYKQAEFPQVVSLRTDRDDSGETFDEMSWSDDGTTRGAAWQWNLSNADRVFGSRSNVDTGDRRVWVLPDVLVSNAPSVVVGDRIYEAGCDSIDSETPVWSIRRIKKVHYDTQLLCDCVLFVDKVTVEQSSVSQDASTGFQSETWSVLIRNQFVSIQSLDAMTRLDLLQRGIEITHKMTFDLDPQISGTRERILFGTRYFTPAGPSVKTPGNSRLWEVMVKEQTKARL